MTRTKLFHFNLTDWTWWTWLITTVLLVAGLAGYREAFIAAMILTGIQTIPFVIYEKSATAFSVQLRIAYLLLLATAFLPNMQWLFWWPAIGTLGMVIFGYCLLARMLSLMPWIVRQPYTIDRLKRTFLSRPNLDRVTEPLKSPGCAGGLCTIEAQVASASGSSKSSVAPKSFGISSMKASAI